MLKSGNSCRDNPLQRCGASFSDGGGCWGYRKIVDPEPGTTIVLHQQQQVQGCQKEIFVSKNDTHRRMFWRRPECAKGSSDVKLIFLRDFGVFPHLRCVYWLMYNYTLKGR